MFGYSWVTKLDAHMMRSKCVKCHHSFHCGTGSSLHRLKWSRERERGLLKICSRHIWTKQTISETLSDFPCHFDLRLVIFSDLVVECRRSHWISCRAEDVLLHPMATWKVDRRGAGQLGMLGSLAFAILIAYIRPFDVCVFACLYYSLHMKFYEKHLSTH